MQHSTTTGIASGQEPREPWIAERDLAYRAFESQSSQPTNLSCLDLFFCQDQRRKRVVVYVHGGHWIGGDKSEIEGYPRLLDFLIGNDCIVASVNFSLIRKGSARTVTYQDQARDIAAALKWLTSHVEKYGGRPEGFILLGYSSGAHLAALVALDERYLGSQGLDAALVRSVIAMDVHAYDIPAALALMEGTPLKANIPLLTSLFGESRTEQEAASPASYLSNGERKSFLLFSCALSGRLPQTVSRTISESLKEKLIAHGHEAVHEHLEHHDHRSILSRFGNRYDKVSEKLKVFLDLEAATQGTLPDSQKLSLSRHSRDLKLNAVRLTETTDRPVAEIAREFGVSVAELYAWKKEFKRHGEMSASLRGGMNRPGPLTGATDLPARSPEFSEEFKREAVRLAETTGRPAAQIAREIGVRVGELYRWKKEFRRQSKISGAPRGGTSLSGSLTGASDSLAGDAEFSEEFKKEAVHLTETSGRSVAQIAREIGVRVGELYAWRKEFKRQGKMREAPRGGTIRPGSLTGATEAQVSGDAEFSEEFKREAVRLLESSGGPASQIARELKIPLNKLYLWRKKYTGAA